MPGTIKRLAVSFYANSMIYQQASLYDVKPELPQFQSIASQSAMFYLGIISLVLILIGAVWFQRREYRDLA
jgi:ABC-type nickel/cobalt efflux system permease component RcnA